MRKPTVTAILFCLASTLGVAAPPPIYELAQLGKASEAVLPEHFVSNDLDLNHEPKYMSSYPELGTFSHSAGSPFQPLAQQRITTPVLALPQRSAPSSIRFEPMKHTEPAESVSFSRLSSQRVVSQRVASRRTRQARPVIPITPGLSANLQTKLKTPGSRGFMLLPHKFEHVPSSWFDAVHENARTRYMLSKWRHPLKVELDYREIENILSNRFNLLPIGRYVYIMTIDENLSKRVEPGKVMIRFHRSLEMPGKPALQTKMSVWSVTDDGQTLVFLGLYHAPETFFKNLLRKSGAQKFRLETWPYARQYTYLNPVAFDPSERA